jgi:hypothetical protein
LRFTLLNKKGLVNLKAKSEGVSTSINTSALARIKCMIQKAFLIQKR